MFKNDVIELRQQAFVNGQWLDADAVEEVVNPATGERLGTVPQLSGAQVDACIAAAEQAYYLWREVPVRERCALLQAWYELIMAERERLARILTLEQGKPLAEALGEITYAASYIQWFAQPSLLDGGATLPYGETPLSMLVVKEPVGVCAAITPWNFPAAMITRKVAPALAAGCTMIVKPAPDTPFTALTLAELAQRAGLPAGVLNVITGDAQQVGAQITASKQVRKLSFTGSTAVGRLLMAQCAPTLKRLSLELGGNAPFVVCADADIEAAVDGAIAAKFRNAGQTCVCANALFVADEVYQPFAERLVEKVQQLRLGSGDQTDVTIGPLINRTALHKVEKLLLDALAKGAKLLCGGKRWQSDANWFLPTVLADASFAMECVQEEIFGPVAPLVRFTDETQLIQQLRQQEAGLAAYVYSQDLKRIQRFARELEVGMVGVNTGLISDAAVPFGGVKASGMGREGGRQGIEEYLETKYIKLSN